ncbi:MAG: sigma-70 family RNA polymerase sigma factor [Planctomycetes bacterium]|nr:sigma-70 family RNA polymerase sigma factor [Planctomycetota bacterium]
MALDRRDDDSRAAKAARFATTQWSLVLAAGEGSSATSRDALAALCKTYWYPVYAFIRRRGKPVHDAQDLTQEFFTRLLEKNTVAVAHELTAEQLYERRWAESLLDHIVERLHDEYVRDGKQQQFDVLKFSITAGEAVSHKDAAAKLAVSENAVAVAVHRLRKRYRHLLRAEIAETVDGPDEVDDEIRRLMETLGT